MRLALYTSTLHSEGWTYTDHFGSFSAGDPETTIRLLEVIQRLRRVGGVQRVLLAWQPKRLPDQEALCLDLDRLPSDWADLVDQCVGMLPREEPSRVLVVVE